MNEENATEFSERRLQKIASEVSQTEERFKKRNRVNSTDFMLMMGTALFFDVLQAVISLIPVIGWLISSLISIFAWLTFYLWTSIKGWGASDSVKAYGRKFVVDFALPTFELVPGLDVLPIWTTRAFWQLSLLKAEDLLYNMSEGKADIEKISYLFNELWHGEYAKRRSQENEKMKSEAEKQTSRRP